MYIWGPLEQMQLLKSVVSMSLEGCVSIIRNLRRHMKRYHNSKWQRIVNEEERQKTARKYIPCNHCDEMFASRATLKKHTVTNHVNRFYVCNQCGMKLSHKKLKSAHEKRHPGGTTFTIISHKKKTPHQKISPDDILNTNGKRTATKSVHKSDCDPPKKSFSNQDKKVSPAPSPLIPFLYAYDDMNLDPLYNFRE